MKGAKHKPSTHQATGTRSARTWLDGSRGARTKPHQSEPIRTKSNEKLPCNRVCTRSNRFCYAIHSGRPLLSAVCQTGYRTMKQPTEDSAARAESRGQTV